MMKTRSLFVMTVAAAFALVAVVAPEPTIGQDLPDEELFVPLAESDPVQPVEAASQDPVDLLVAELATQTVEMVNHQAELEARLARVEELVRQARIYAARGGARSNPR